MYGLRRLPSSSGEGDIRGMPRGVRALLRTLAYEDMTPSSVDRRRQQGGGRRWTPPGCAGPWTDLPRLAEDLRRGHTRADPFQFLDGNALEAVLAAGILDRPDDHAPDERRDLLHPGGRGIFPGDCRGRLGAVINGPHLGLSGATDCQERRPRERSRGVGAERILGHEIPAHAVGPG